MRRALSLCTILFGIACGDATGPTPQSVAGTWNLQSVNGSSLPYSVPQGGLANEQIIAGILDVAANRTFTYTTTFRSNFSGQTTSFAATDSGSYAILGNAVRFVFASDSSTGTGVFNGNTVTLAAEGFASLVYTKH